MAMNAPFGGYKAASTQTYKEQAGDSMMEFYTAEKTVYLNPGLLSADRKSGVAPWNSSESPDRARCPRGSSGASTPTSTSSRWPACDGKAYATSNYCTHLDCLLSSGKLVDDGIGCSCHGSVFDLETGEPICPPATEPIKTYPVQERDGEIFVGVRAW